jgi:hypothetical protein
MTWLLFVIVGCCGLPEGQPMSVNTEEGSEVRSAGVVEAPAEPSTVPSCPSVKAMGTSPSFEAHPTPSQPMKKEVGESTVVDYYHHFFSTPLASFKALSAEESHQQKTYNLGTLNPKNGYLSFATQNTPTDWDGDSETEWAYEMTYWVQSPTRRLIALNKTKVTWVSAESVVRFYVHDKEGLRPTSPLKRPWTLTDFTDKDYSAFFPKVLNEEPPVYIRLPEKGKWVEVDLAIHEYFEPMDVYATYQCLKVEPSPIYFLPEEGVFRKTKP